MVRQTDNTMMEEEQEEDVIDLLALLGDFIKVFKKFWWLFLAIVVVVTSGFTAYTYITYTPQYQCQATFTVATDNDESGTYGYYYSQNTADQLSKTFPYILSSSYFRGILLEAMDRDSLNGTITSETVSDSNMVTMTVTSPSAEDALLIIQTAIDVYPTAAKFVLGNIQFHMMNEPSQPTSPYNQPSIIKTGGMGILAGAALGIFVLGIMAFFRKTAKTPEEMEKITNLKCVASIPKETMKARKSRKVQRLSLMDEKVSFGYKEAIRSLQIRLDRSLSQETGNVILLTSTISGEGKSTLSINLAELYAQRGKRVLLIDADLRKQEDARTLGCSRAANLPKILATNPKDVVIHYLEKEKFWFIGGTKKVDKPIEVLSHQRLPGFIESMKSQVDYIIIDTPPCGMFQDSIILQEYADAVIYVVKHDFVPIKKVREGISMLKEGKSVYTGYVFNSCVQGIGNYGYGHYGYGKYGYGQSYQNEQEPRGGIRRRKPLVKEQ